MAYSLHVPASIEARIVRLRASVRKTVRARLQALCEEASERAHAIEPLMGPALRFYVGNLRVFYGIDHGTLRVAVLDLRPAFA